jgi:adenylate cyclase
MTAKVLVVDDEPDLEDLVRQRFRRQIKEGSIAFGFARDGVEALAVLAEQGDFDMVVSDINMPRMDGLTLLAKLQEEATKFSTVIVSAYGDMANIRTAMNRGAFDFLTKPIDFTDFEATLRKTIAHVASARRKRSARMRRYRVIFRPILPGVWRLSRTRLRPAESDARSRLCSPTSPDSRRSSNRSIPNSSRSFSAAISKA